MVFARIKFITGSISLSILEWLGDALYLVLLTEPDFLKCFCARSRKADGSNWPIRFAQTSAFAIALLSGFGQKRPACKTSFTYRDALFLNREERASIWLRSWPPILSRPWGKIFQLPDDSYIFAAQILRCSCQRGGFAHLWKHCRNNGCLQFEQQAHAQLSCMPFCPFFCWAQQTFWWNALLPDRIRG